MTYLKIKFEQPITDYQRNIIVKLVEHIHSFAVAPELLEHYWKSYNLPIPYGRSDFADLLSQIQTCSELCIQDTGRGKIRYDVTPDHHYTASIHLNEFIRHLDMVYAEFASQSSHTNEQIENMASTMRDSLMLINTSMFQFHFTLSNSENMTLEEAKMLYPDSNFYRDSLEFHRLVSATIAIANYESPELSRLRIEALHSSFIMMRGLCAFSMVCSLICDAACGSLEFGKALVWLKESLQRAFHNGHLYQVIFPQTSVNTSKNVDQRGEGDHTTIMKLYLIDRFLNPVLIRIDLPHGHCKTLHLNVQCKTDKKRYLKMNHFELEADQTLDELIPVLDSLRESMLHQMPHMLKILDTTKDDENVFLTEMERFVLYDKMSLNIINEEDYSKELKKVSGYLGVDKSNLIQTMQQSKKKFKL